MITLGVDPPNGRAVLDCDDLLFYAQWSKEINEAKLASNIEAAVTEALDLGARVLAIEGQYGEFRASIDKKKRAGLIRSTLVLASRAGMWKQEWLRQSRERYGTSLPIVVKPPTEWRDEVLGRYAPKKTREVNPYVIQFMGAMYDVDLAKKEDAANAIGVARSVSVGLRYRRLLP